jgi:hypothetical protein
MGSGAQQVGYVIVPGGDRRASLWAGTAASWVDLHPANATFSEAHATTGTMQAGLAVIDGMWRASVWTGTASSWVDLNPLCAVSSRIHDAAGSFQVGYAIDDSGLATALLWSGAADSWVNLSAFLPGSWEDTIARGVWSDGLTLHIVGEGYNIDTGRTEALLWTFTGDGPIDCPGDTNGDGAVDFADLNAILATYGESGFADGDVNGDCAVEFSDLNEVMSNYGGECE